MSPPIGLVPPPESGSQIETPRISETEHDRRRLGASQISGRVWKRVSALVTVAMVSGAVILGVSIASTAPLTSPVTPPVAAAEADPATVPGAGAADAGDGQGARAGGGGFRGGGRRDGR